MSATNPYAAPQAEVQDVPSGAVDLRQLRRVASGQRLVIYSILASLLAIPLQLAIGPFALVLTVAALVLSITGVVRALGGLGRGLVAKVLYVIGMFFPLINLLLMISLSLQCTKAIRAAGFRVGFLGAKVA